MKKIGNLKRKNRYFLAPMAEVNDIAFRLLCKKAGCGLTYTGMINPLTKQKLYLDDRPALQIFCNSEKGIKEFIKKYEKKVSLFDFNLGCPTKNAKKLCFGSFMHADLKKIEKILRVMRKSTKKPITIKLRKTEKTLDIIHIAEKYCDAISIHPRTPSQGYSGKPDVKFAEEIKEKTKLPIIYSGDVNEKNAEELLEKFDFVMLGREAIGRPDIFSKLTGKKAKIYFRDYLKLALKYKIKFGQIKFQAMKFTKGKKSGKKIRPKLALAKNLEKIKELMKEN